jgi:hypothetical protein
VVFIKIFSFFAGQVLKTKWKSLRDNFWKERVKITKQTTGKGTSDKHPSQWKYYQQLSFLTDVFSPRNMKSNIPPTDVDTIVVDVNEDTCDIFTENSNVEEMSTEPMPESKDTNTAANHSFPANTSRNSETSVEKKKQKKPSTFSVAGIGRKKIGEGCATEIDYVYSGRRRLPLFYEFVASS